MYDPSVDGEVLCPSLWGKRHAITSKRALEGSLTAKHVLN